LFRGKIWILIGQNNFEKKTNYSEQLIFRGKMIVNLEKSSARKRDVMKWHVIINTRNPDIYIYIYIHTYMWWNDMEGTMSFGNSLKGPYSCRRYVAAGWDWIQRHQGRQRDNWGFNELIVYLKYNEKWNV